MKREHTAVAKQTGKVAMEGPACELADNDQVRRAYLGG